MWSNVIDGMRSVILILITCDIFDLQCFPHLTVGTTIKVKRPKGYATERNYNLWINKCSLNQTQIRAYGQGI